MLSLLIFVGEAVRDAFDPRKLFAGAPPPETDPGNEKVTPLPASTVESKP
jgi:microcin C transport system permease protein